MEVKRHFLKTGHSLVTTRQQNNKMALWNEETEEQLISMVQERPSVSLKA